MRTTMETVSKNEDHFFRKDSYRIRIKTNRSSNQDIWPTNHQYGISLKHHFTLRNPFATSNTWSPWTWFQTSLLLLGGPRPSKWPKIHGSAPVFFHPSHKGFCFATICKLFFFPHLVGLSFQTFNGVNPPYVGVYTDPPVHRSIQRRLTKTRPPLAKECPPA